MTGSKARIRGDWKGGFDSPGLVSETSSMISGSGASLTGGKEGGGGGGGGSSLFTVTGLGAAAGVGTAAGKWIRRFSWLRLMNKS